MTVANQQCPSRLELAAWAAEAGGRPADVNEPVAPHVAGCSRCQAHLRELDEARKELLGPDPARASQNAARLILAAAQARKAPRFGWRFVFSVAALPAAALLALVVLPSEQPVSESAAAVDTIRTKGAFALSIVSKRGEALERLGDGDEAKAGDRLRFAYTQVRSGHLMVFSVDDGGAISPYYDESRLHSVPVAAGSQVTLPGSVELDDHKGLERIYALWAPQPIDGASVQAAVRKALSQAGGDVARMGKLTVGAEETSVLLRRP